jgi:hypothetical protein
VADSQFPKYRDSLIKVSGFSSENVVNTGYFVVMLLISLLEQFLFMTGILLVFGVVPRNIFSAFTFSTPQ